jgi:hypothetical protein
MSPAFRYVAPALLVTLFVSLALGESISPLDTVPSAEAILLDGKCAEAEWRAARTVALAKGYTLKMQKSSRYFFLCVVPSHPTMFMTELYVASAPTTRVLHASAKLGEHVFAKGEPITAPNDYAWWQVDGWWASTLRAQAAMDREEAPFLPSEAIEYQLDRRVFWGKKLRVMLDVSGGSVVYPATALVSDVGSWADIDLGD